MVVSGRDTLLNASSVQPIYTLHCPPLRRALLDYLTFGMGGHCFYLADDRDRLIYTIELLKSSPLYRKEQGRILIINYYIRTINN